MPFMPSDTVDFLVPRVHGVQQYANQRLSIETCQAKMVPGG